MNCSKCRSSNLDEANFCRTCGNNFQKSPANSLPEVKKPAYEKAIKQFVLSIGLFVTALITFLSDTPVWWWFLISGIGILAQSILQAFKARRLASANHLQITTMPANSIQATSVLLDLDSQVKITSEMVTPPGVGERTAELFDRQ
jgi:uncharacterized protein (DUF983 family)